MMRALLPKSAWRRRSRSALGGARRQESEPVRVAGNLNHDRIDFVKAPGFIGSAEARQRSGSEPDNGNVQRTAFPRANRLDRAAHRRLVVIVSDRLRPAVHGLAIIVFDLLGAMDG